MFVIHHGKVSEQLKGHSNYYRRIICTQIGIRNFYVRANYRHCILYTYSYEDRLSLVLCTSRADKSVESFLNLRPHSTYTLTPKLTLAPFIVVRFAFCSFEFPSPRRDVNCIHYDSNLWLEKLCWSGCSHSSPSSHRLLCLFPHIFRHHFHISSFKLTLKSSST